MSQLFLPFGNDSLIKAMKKGNLPSYIFDDALAFFNGEPITPQADLKDGSIFEKVISLPTLFSILIFIRIEIYNIYIFFSLDSILTFVVDN